MENSYQPELWRDLYVMLGTSSAALIGLLFVVTSLHLDEIINNVVYRTRARNNSIYLMFTLVEAAIVLTPQPMAFLGTELMVINFVLLWLPLRFIYWFFCRDRAISKRAGWAIHRAIFFIAGFLLGFVGGAIIAVSSYFGLYLVTAGYVVFLVMIVLNAWSIMLGVGQMGETSNRSRAPARRRRV